jgi:hypothetical protein
MDVNETIVIVGGKAQILASPPFRTHVQEYMD